jgi:voltage-gated potassium channel
MLLIAINVLLVVINTDPYFASKFHILSGWYVRFECVSVVVFVVEYILRLWSCVESPKTSSRVRWALRPLALIDLVCLVPCTLSSAHAERRPRREWLGAAHC